MKPLGYRAVLRRYPAFRRLWLGDVVSFLGDWFNVIALYTAVQHISSSAVAVVLVMVFKTLPNFLVSPIAGPIVDRYDRRVLLLVSDFARAACALGLVAAYLAESLVGLYGCTIVMVLFTGLAFPAKKAALPMVVEGEHIGVANALLGGTWSVMLAFGAALGGAFTAWLGVGASFALDGVTFLVSAWFFYRLPALRPPEAADRARTTFAEGVRYLRRTPYVLALTSLKPLAAFSNGAMATIPFYGTVAFAGRSGALWVGLLYAARGAGATIGSLVVRMVIGDTPRNLRRFIVLSYALMAGSLYFLSQADSYAIAALAFFVSALGSSSVWVFSGTLLQVEADRSYHGRIFSLEFGVMTLVLAAASFGVGHALDGGWTLSEVARLCALLAVPPAAFWLGVLVVMRRRIRRDVDRRLRESYATAAEEPHLLAASRQYRYGRLMQDDRE